MSVTLGSASVGLFRSLLLADRSESTNECQPSVSHLMLVTTGFLGFLHSYISAWAGWTWIILLEFEDVCAWWLSFAKSCITSHSFFSYYWFSSLSPLWHYLGTDFFQSTHKCNRWRNSLINIWRSRSVISYDFNQKTPEACFPRLRSLKAIVYPNNLSLFLFSGVAGFTVFWVLSHLWCPWILSTSPWGPVSQVPSFDIYRWGGQGSQNL